VPLQQGVERACSCQLATVKREISSSRAGNFAMYGVVRRPIGRDLVLIDMEAHLGLHLIHHPAHRRLEATTMTRLALFIALLLTLAFAAAQHNSELSCSRRRKTHPRKEPDRSNTLTSSSKLKRTCRT
jgi:hypothetical protein